MRSILSCLLIFSLVCLFFECDDSPGYDEEWMIGKNIAVVEERYGEFEAITDEVFLAEHNWGVASYILKEYRANIFFGDTIYGTRLKIWFNKNHIVTGTIVASNGTGG